MTAWLPALLHWLDAWVRTPGFGGGAALTAAAIAYIGAARARRAENRRAREARWWEQARWATTLATSANPDEAMIGAYALRHLIREAHDAEAGRFADAAFLALVDRDADADEPAEDVDEEEHDDAQ